MIPPELRYTVDHEWVRPAGQGGVRVGITDYAQHSLGDVVFVQLPETGDRANAGEPLGEVESTKSVSEVLAPLDGTVTALNNALDTSPELVNTDPYGDGWLYEMDPDDPDAAGGLMDGDAYADSIGEG